VKTSNLTLSFVCFCTNTELILQVESRRFRWLFISLRITAFENFVGPSSGILIIENTVFQKLYLSTPSGEGVRNLICWVSGLDPVRLALSKEHNRWGVSHHSPEDANRCRSRNTLSFNYLELWTMGKVLKPSDSEVEIVLRQLGILILDNDIWKRICYHMWCQWWWNLYYVHTLGVEYSIYWLVTLGYFQCWGTTVPRTERATDVKQLVDWQLANCMGVLVENPPQ
jgi:hypothetical protein